MWRKMILTGFKGGMLALLLFTTSCGIWKSKQAVDVQFEIFQAFPYCGGAAPTPDMLEPQLDAFASCSLAICEVNENGERGKWMTTIVTDENGLAKSALPKGKYQLWLPSKLESFEEFMKIEKSVKGKFYSYEEVACFRTWYETPDFEFEVGTETSFKFVYNNRCFTGHHPCLIYTGPFPP